MTRPAASLRRRLTVGVVLALGLSLVAFSLVLYATFRGALWRQFEERLAQDARAVANMVEERAHGRWQFEPAALEEFERKFGAAYFEVWSDDDTVLARSQSLGKRDLEAVGKFDGTIVDGIVLPDGMPGRLLLASLPPRRAAPARSTRKLKVAVARETEEVEASLATLRWLLLGSGLAVLAAAVLAAVLAVRGGLRPVARLARRIDEMDATDLGERLPVADLPSELRPPVVRLNQLLGRLEDSFKRERQFSSDVSHELRSPIAGLRSLLEVAASRDRSAAEYRATLDDALQVAVQMNALVENLLMLARLDAHQVQVTEEEVAVRELVDDVFRPFAERARERGLRFENRVPAATFFTSDREKLRIVIANLLANAVDYTEPGGSITVDAADLLTVADSGPPIPEDALDRIFDRFVRLDPSRSGTGEHCGIGLSLARALCQALGLSISAENRPDGWVAFTLRMTSSPPWPRAASIPPTATT